MRILIVDDNPITVEVIAMRLEAAGHEVETSLDGHEVKSLLAAERFDAVILDVNMPVLSGDRVALLIREAVNPPPVLLHSSRDAEDLERIAARCGAAGYLEKSNDDQAFLQKLEAVLREHQGDHV